MTTSASSSGSGGQILHESEVIYAETDCDTDALLSGPEEVEQESLPSSTSPGDQCDRHGNTMPNISRIKMFVLEGWFMCELRKLIKLFIPVSLSFLFQISLLWISLVFLGHLPDLPESKKSSQYTAAGLGSSLLNVTGLAIGHGIATASDTLSSQAYGFKNYKRVGVILQRGILILSLTLFPIWAIWLNTESLLLVVHQPPCVARFGALYVKLFSLAIPFNLLYILLQHYLQSQSIVWQFVLIGVLTNCINVVLHAITIYGLKLGFTGAVIALVISNVVPPFLVIGYVWCRKLHKETWGGWSFESLEEWGLYIKLAIPGLLMLALEWWGFEVLNFMAGAIGETELAVNIVWFQLAVILFMPALGLSIAVSIRVGNELGAGNPMGAKRAAYAAVATVLTFSTAASILLLSAKDVIARIFIPDNDEVAKKVSQLMYIAWIFDFFDFLQVVISGVLRGSGRQYIGAIVNFIAYYIIGIPLAAVLGFKTNLGVFGIWIGMAIGNCSQCVVFLLVLVFTDWKKESDKAIRRAKVTTPKEDDPPVNGDNTDGEGVADNSNTSSLDSINCIGESGDRENLISDIELQNIDKKHRSEPTNNIPKIKFSYQMKKLLFHGSLYFVGICILIIGGVSSRYQPNVAPEEYSNCSDFDNSSYASGDTFLQL